MILPLICFLGTIGNGATKTQTYMIWNYTWIIENQAGDVASSSSTTGSSPTWGPLFVDLCTLAMGADSRWGMPDTFLPQKTPINDKTYQGEYPGCHNALTRTVLQSASFYVCPGTTHRPRELNYKCGYEADYYCAAWACETTGDTYWRPFSKTDYITVKRT